MPVDAPPPPAKLSTSISAVEQLRHRPAAAFERELIALGRAGLRIPTGADFESQIAAAAVDRFEAMDVQRALDDAKGHVRPT
jgi:hypothetical protein